MTAGDVVGLAQGGVEGRGSSCSLSELAWSSWWTTVETEDSQAEDEAETEEERDDNGDASEELESLKIESSEDGGFEGRSLPWGSPLLGS